MRYIFRSCFYQVHNVDRTSLCCSCTGNGTLFLLSFPPAPPYASNVSQNNGLGPQRFTFELVLVPLSSHLIVILISKVCLPPLISLCYRFGLWISGSILSQLSGCYPRSPHCDPGICVMCNTFSIFYYFFCRYWSLVLRPA